MPSTIVVEGVKQLLEFFHLHNTQPYRLVSLSILNNRMPYLAELQTASLRTCSLLSPSGRSPSADIAQKLGSPYSSTVARLRPAKLLLLWLLMLRRRRSCGGGAAASAAAAAAPAALLCTLQ